MVKPYIKGEGALSWLLAAPALILLFVFIVVPFAMAFGYALTNQRLVPNLSVPTQFVFMRNYQRLLEDEAFHQALRNNFFFALVVVPAQTIFGLLLALLVSQKLRFSRLFQTIYFSPTMISAVVAAQVWAVMYVGEPEGAINTVVRTLTLGQIGAQNWLRDDQLALPALMVLAIWHGVGLMMVIYIAGLQDIPTPLYEAAQMDGANPLQQFFYITLPQLRNATIFVVLTATILAFRLFTPVEYLTRGGPGRATTTAIHQAYQHGFQQQRIGYASAITVVFFLIVLLVAIVQRLALESKGTND